MDTLILSSTSTLPQVVLDVLAKTNDDVKNLVTALEEPGCRFALSFSDRPEADGQGCPVDPAAIVNALMHQHREAVRRYAAQLQEVPPMRCTGEPCQHDIDALVRAEAGCKREWEAVGETKRWYEQARNSPLLSRHQDSPVLRIGLSLAR